MKLNKNQYIVGGVVLIVLILGFFLYKNFTKPSATKTQESVLQNEPTIAPVDNSVSVDLVSGVKKGEISISIKNAPSGTQTAKMDITYNRERRPEDETTDEVIPDGAIASCQFDSGARDCTKDGITLGTCSSGVCRYHTVVGKIKLSILFTGSYGEKIFEKEYSL